MGGKEVNPAVATAVIVVLLGIAAFFGFRAAQPAQPRAGSYTPGVPPWMEKKAGTTGTSGAPAAPAAPTMPVANGQNGVHLPPADAAKLGVAPSPSH